MLSEQTINPTSSVAIHWRKRSHQPDDWTPWQPFTQQIVLKEYDKFEIRWSGPTGAILSVEGLEPLYDQKPLKWVGDGALWFPGTYRISIRLNDVDLWLSRIEVTSQRASYRTFAPRMIETVEAWIPGITQESVRGVLSHSMTRPGSPNTDIAKVGTCVVCIRNVLSHPEIEFVLHNAKPKANANTRDNRTVLKGVLWLQGYVNERIRTLRAMPSSDAHLNNRIQMLTTCRYQIDRLLRHPLWDLVDAPRSGDKLTQRGYRRRPYRRVIESLAELYYGPRGDAIFSEELTRVRPTPEIFELWVLRNVIQTVRELGWRPVSAPPWGRHSRQFGISDPLNLSNSRWIFDHESARLTLHYDRPLPDNIRAAESADGLWMSGQHNRPDFILLHEKPGRLPRVSVIEAKYRPRHMVWPDNNTRTDSSKGQLQQYWSGLMLGKAHLDPPVVCVIPENKEPTWRADKTPDIEFVTMNPGLEEASWKEYLTSRLPIPSLEEDSYVR